jgi:hypothetical protein
VKIIIPVRQSAKLLKDQWVEFQKEIRDAHESLEKAKLMQQGH